MISDLPADAATVLVVDDDNVAATDLRDRLTGSGYAVRVAISAEDALAPFKAAQAVDVDLILLNLLLPDTDGLILCSSLRACTTAPIIVLSARPREVDRQLALELGANEFLTKPVDMDDLLVRIAAVISRRHAIIGRLRLMP